MNTHQITVPTWMYDFARGVYHNWGVAVATIVTALLVGFVAEYVKHKYTLKQGKKLETLAVHKVLIGLALLTTALQYAIPFLQTNMRALETLPYIGAYATGIYAAANYLYAFKGKQWYQSILNTAQKLDANLTAPPVSTEVTPTDSLE